MLIARNMLAAIILSSILAFVLSYLPAFGLRQEAQPAAVFQLADKVSLNKNNLVDLLTTLNTHQGITHAEWENSNLFLDFRINIDQPIYVDDLYDDLFSVMSTAYLKTNNIQGLYIRFLYPQNKKQEVLLALSAERSKELTEALQEALQIQDKKPFLTRYTTISYGVLWKEKTGQ